jgi:GNAT superfamily N-acetyltransferase
LTDAGHAAFEPLDSASRAQITALMSRLKGDQPGELLKAMRTIETLLGERSPPVTPYILRPHQVGDMGWITHRQGILYNHEYGWDETFEALVAEIAGAFVKNYDPHWERCWIAERDERIVGSVFLVRESDGIGKLRLLYVEPEARGFGIGRRLVDECIRTARQKGYRTLILWTNDVLVAARRIYQAAGFKLIEEERHHSFGKDLIGQNWSLEL